MVTQPTGPNRIICTGVRKLKRRTPGGWYIQERWCRQTSKAPTAAHLLCRNCAPVQSSADCRQSDEVVCEREHSSFAPGEGGTRWPDVKSVESAVFNQLPRGKPTHSGPGAQTTRNTVFKRIPTDVCSKFNS